MLLLCCFSCLVLCSHALLSSRASLDCNMTQYPWPLNSPKFCCNKCLPGQRMVRRSEDSCDITCHLCQRTQYRDSYNVEMRCLFCKACDKENMITKSPCNATHNTVCICKAGYRCKNTACTACELIPTTTTKKPTLPPSTTALKPSTPTTDTDTDRDTDMQPMRDTVWFLVIIALLCSGLALLVVTKVKLFLQWTRSIYGYFLAGKQEYTEDTGIEDNDMPKPVQEVCGKCDQPIEV